MLRRIIRRAIRHGHKLGAASRSSSHAGRCAWREMGDAFPELRESVQVVEARPQSEEERFRDLDHGMRILDEAIAGSVGARTIAGRDVFKLYDTYGFPSDLTADIARERG